MRLLANFITLSLLSVAYGAPQLQFGQTLLTGRPIESLGVDFYGGLPFAEPPVGPLRFRPPISKSSINSSTFDASDFGNSCVQPPSSLNLTTMSEDCLNINVFRPASVSPNARLPVLFWTYGGGFTYGSSSGYNGSQLVARSIERGTPVIYVNFNYRLGPFGWPQGQEAENERALNLGLRDQVAALNWVQQNIHYFGGDKTKVTAYGESAGSLMTAILFLDSHLDGLARAAIFQSGQASSFVNPVAAFREGDWQSLVRDVPSCAGSQSSSTFGCLRNATAQQILSAWSGLLINTSGAVFPFETILFQITVDPSPKSLLSDLPSRLYSQGRFSRLPFISGSNKDEGTIAALRRPNITEADVKAHLLELNSPSLVPGNALEEAVKRVVELYPNVPALGSPFDTGDELFGLPSSYKQDAAILGDLLFESPRRLWLQSATSRGVKAYSYRFAQPLSSGTLGNPSLGVTHGSELSYPYGSPVDQSPASRKLSTFMMDYWISFTVNLDPNDQHGEKRPTWPRYTHSDPVLLQLHGTNTTTIPDDFRKENIEFFNSNPVIWRH